MLWNFTEHRNRRGIVLQAAAAGRHLSLSRRTPIMTTLSDKLMLFICCTLLLYAQMPDTGLFHVLAILTGVTFTCFCGCCNADCLSWQDLPPKNRILLTGLWLLFAGISLCTAEFSCFLPLLFYETALAFPVFSLRNRKSLSAQTANTLENPAAGSIAFFPAALSPALCLIPFSSMRNMPSFCPWIVIFPFALAWILAAKTFRLCRMEENFRLLRDSATEYNLLLQQKNKDLIEKQNHEIHIATLKERNRIAREIHDNVGHMLSRSILQAGALSAVNQQENLKTPLNDLTETLSTAMTSVRESVHNLHDDSIDLKGAVLELISGFSDYRIHLDYDMGHYVPAPVKYCFISIVKEALSNIARHSNGSEIFITLREHPSLYQLIIKDNGTAVHQNHTGMGIANMQERIKRLNGNFSLSAKDGFQIFAAVPRERHE